MITSQEMASTILEKGADGRSEFSEKKKPYQINFDSCNYGRSQHLNFSSTKILQARSNETLTFFECILLNKDFLCFSDSKFRLILLCTNKITVLYVTGIFSHLADQSEVAK